jgi:hypothetical protein
MCRLTKLPGSRRISRPVELSWPLPSRKGPQRRARVLRETRNGTTRPGGLGRGLTAGRGHWVGVVDEDDPVADDDLVIDPFASESHETTCTGPGGLGPAVRGVPRPRRLQITVAASVWWIESPEAGRAFRGASSDRGSTDFRRRGRHGIRESKPRANGSAKVLFTPAGVAVSQSSWTCDDGPAAPDVPKPIWVGKSGFTHIGPAATGPPYTCEPI